VKVVVVGGGIAGLCCAYYLRRQDVEVTVVERARVGSRTASSWGNGGWIAPAQAGPLPEPGLTVYGLRALVRADSALYFRPRYLPRLAPWLLRFWTYCNVRDHDHGTAALAALGRRSFELVDGLADDGVSFDVWKLGMVCATGTVDGARKVLRSLEGLRRQGFDLPEDVLDEQEIHDLEPALNDRVKAGFHLAEQWNVKADTLVEGLARRLRELGVEFVEDSDVTGFDRAGETVRAVRTTNGEVGGDRVILAAGRLDDAARSESRCPHPDGAGEGVLVLAPPEGDAAARDPLRRHPRRRHAARRPRPDRRHDGVLRLRPLDRQAAHRQPLPARPRLHRARETRIRGTLGGPAADDGRRASDPRPGGGRS
jgi:glycine/D-amino acid oxidase-like deaminating enzyme